MKKLTQFTALLFIAITVTGCQQDEPSKKSPSSEPESKVSAASEPTANAAISFPCLNAPSIPATPEAVAKSTPGDTPITSQDSLNCFAWQTFIGLNLQVDPSNPGVPDPNAKPADFGPAGTEQTGVWETYANANNVMRPKGQTPLPWGDKAAVVSACSAAMNDQSLSGPVRVMASSRIGSKVNFNLSEDAAQAFPFGNPNWLADKNGNLVFYEILMDKDEFDYILHNKLYNLNDQKSYLEANNNLSMPLGHDNVLGGLEIKAAWLLVTDPDNSKWQRFKITQAYVYDENTRQCNEQTMALVGMHIIHKTASQPQWVWATFEHVDNAPDSADIKRDKTVDGDYTFYSNTCKVLPVPDGCKAKTVNGVAVTQTSCDANVSPAYNLTVTDNCPAYPVRVSRDFKIKDTTDNHIASLNTAVQAMIKQANPDSVFANYQLVNVLWSSAAVNDNVPPGNPPVAPLSISGETPALTTVPVANTMLETYAQGFNCLSCHSFASISSKAKASKNYATDYSFIFGLAQKPD
jgi:hypothetical protein